MKAKLKANVKVSRIFAGILTTAMVFGAGIEFGAGAQVSAAAQTAYTPTQSQVQNQTQNQTPPPAKVTYPPTLTIAKDEPTLFTDEQLLEIITQAPYITKTRSASTFPERRITEQELEAWIVEYWELGGPNAYELEVIRLINEIRQNYGLHPLAINPNLMMAARFHSQEMVDLRYFAHRSEIHGRATARAAMFGHVNQTAGIYGVGENLHGGAFTPERAVRGWMNSPGHRRNILCPYFLTIGIGAVRMTEIGGGRTTAKFGP